MTEASLSAPEGVSGDPQAVEIARVWLTSKGQTARIAASLWDDPAAWGLMLVDLARGVAETFAKEQDADVDAVLARIREGFDAEWDYPTGKDESSV